MLGRISAQKEKNMFKKAERKQAKLRLALSGPSGSGKTTGALRIAKGIGGKIAVLDTERGSASLYADICDFDVVELQPPYTPERYMEVINAAAKEGYDTLILDSITHEWNGQGGILEIVDNIARTRFKGNSYAAWNEGTPRHQKFIDAMLASPLHIIATMRSKSVYVETEKSNGKRAIEKQGSAPQQRDGLEYEFTVVLDLSVDGNIANASKDRTRMFRDPFLISEETGRKLSEWLNSGKSFAEQARDCAKNENPDPMTQSQHNALMTYLRRRHGDDRRAYIEELSSFFNLEIRSSRELTRSMASEFLNAVMSERGAPDGDA